MAEQVGGERCAASASGNLEQCIQPGRVACARVADGSAGGKAATLFEARAKLRELHHTPGRIPLRAGFLLPRTLLTRELVVNNPMSAGIFAICQLRKHLAVVGPAKGVAFAIVMHDSHVTRCVAGRTTKVIKRPQVDAGDTGARLLTAGRADTRSVIRHSTSPFRCNHRGA